jgi:hypothetical protein
VTALWDLSAYLKSGPAYTGTFRKVVGGEAVRTKEMVGEFMNLPKEGHPFVMFGEPLDKTQNARMIHTSPVVGIVSDTGSSVLFRTENSTYEVDYKEAKG